MEKITTENIFNAARIHNSEVANLKDYQLYLSRCDRELRALAAEAVEVPIVGTAKEIGERYGRYFDSDRKWEYVCDLNDEYGFKNAEVIKT